MAGKASRRGTGAGSERAAIALLSELFAGGSSRGRRIEVGIGDDAAVIAPGRDRLVWTVDVCIENVHFDRRFLSLADVGFRSLNSAASDLAAMGAQPLAALSSLVVPSRIAKRELRELGQGQAEASRQLKLSDRWRQHLARFRAGRHHHRAGRGAAADPSQRRASG